MKIKIPKIKKSFKKGSSVININFYWDMILLIAFCVILFAFIFGFLVFRRVNTEIGFSAENTGKEIRTFKKERLDQVLEYFAEREAKSKAILFSPSPIVDPSL